MRPPQKKPKARQTSCARGDTICPRASPPRGRSSASRAAEQTQRSSSFPTPNTFSRSPLHLLHALRPGDLDLENGVRVTCATSLPILVFLGLSVLELGPMYVRQTSDKSSLNAPA